MKKWEVSIMDKEQIQVEDFLQTIRNKKWTWACHVMHKTDNRGTTKERKPINCRSHSTQRTSWWKNEMREFAETEYEIH